MTTKFATLHQQMLRGFDELTLLVPSDGSGSAPEILVRPITNLDDDQRRPIEHDEIEFAHFATIVAGDQFEPSLLEVRQCQRLTEKAKRLSFAILHGAQNAWGNPLVECN